MSFLAKIQEAGFGDELTSVVTSFLSDEKDGESNKALMEAVDADGCRGKQVMRVVGNFQREGKIKPGLYKALGDLDTKYNEATGNSGEDSGNSGTEKRKKREPKPVVTDAEVNSLLESVTDTEKDRLGDKFERLAERMRQNLMRRKLQMIANLKNREAGIAQRKGVSLEVAKQIKEKMDAIDAHKIDLKTVNAQIKVIRDEIKVLKPSRKRKKKGDQPDEAAAAPTESTPAEATA